MSKKGKERRERIKFLNSLDPEKQKDIEFEEMVIDTLVKGVKNDYSLFRALTVLVLAEPTQLAALKYDLLNAHYANFLALGQIDLRMQSEIKQGIQLDENTRMKRLLSTLYSVFSGQSRVESRGFEYEPELSLRKWYENEVQAAQDIKDGKVDNTPDPMTIFVPSSDDATHPSKLPKFESLEERTEYLTNHGYTAY